MNPVSIVSVGDTESGTIDALEKQAGALNIVRRCPELVDLLAACQSGLAQVAVVADAADALTATLVDRLTAVGVSVVAVAATPVEASRLRGIGAFPVPANPSPELLTEIVLATITARKFPQVSGFSVPAISAVEISPREISQSELSAEPFVEASLEPQGNIENTGTVAAPGLLTPELASLSSLGLRPSDTKVPAGSALTEVRPSSAPSAPMRPRNGHQRVLRGLPPNVLSTLSQLWQDRPKGKSKSKRGVELTTNRKSAELQARKVSAVAGRDSGQSSLTSNVPSTEKRLPSQTLAVWGPIGSPGRTTLAVNLAAEFAVQGRRVMVIDADSYGASIAATLGLLDESASFAQACRVADQGLLTGAELERICTEVVFSGGTFGLLSGLTRADRWPELRAAAVERVFQTALKVVDLVIIDCGFCLENDEELSYDTVAPRRNAATICALSQADIIYAVGGGDAIGIPRLIRALADLSELCAGADIHVVLNKVRKNAVGSSPLKALEQAWERFGPEFPIRYFVPWDAEIMDRALLEGRLLLEVAPESPIRRAILEVCCAPAQRK